VGVGVGVGVGVSLAHGHWTWLEKQDRDIHFAMAYPSVKDFKSLIPGPNVLKLFTAVIYCHSMVIPSFCVIKHYYCSKYHRMAVYNPNKKFYNIGPR
jgi:hypothetical protein